MHVDQYLYGKASYNIYLQTHYTRTLARSGEKEYNTGNTQGLAQIFPALSKRKNVQKLRIFHLDD